jgi:hypothetical protein
VVEIVTNTVIAVSKLQERVTVTIENEDAVIIANSSEFVIPMALA